MLGTQEVMRLGAGWERFDGALQITHRLILPMFATGVKGQVHEFILI
jgi:hypothetical protein